MSPKDACRVQKSPENVRGVQMSPENALPVQNSPGSVRGAQIPPGNTGHAMLERCYSWESARRFENSSTMISRHFGSTRAPNTPELLGMTSPSNCMPSEGVQVILAVFA